MIAKAKQVHSSQPASSPPVASVETHKSVRVGHPLREVKKCGPKPLADVLDVGDQVLADATKVLAALDSNVVERLRPSRADCLLETGPLGRTITAEQECILARRAHKGDTVARDILVEKNTGIVKKMVHTRSRDSCHLEDLYQQGMLGLLRAVETFDPARGLRFTTYAVHWIRASTNRYRTKQLDQESPAISDDVLGKNESIFGTRRDGSQFRRRLDSYSIDNLLVRADGDESGESILRLPDTGAALAEQTEQKQRDLKVREILVDIAGEAENYVATNRTSLWTQLVFDRLLSDEPLTLQQVGNQHDMSREGARLMEQRILRLAKKRLLLLVD